jgi:thiamine biosynthesis lipoprotein
LSRLSFLSGINAQIVALFVLLHSTMASAGWQKQEQDIMGTRIIVEVYADDDATAQETIAAVMAEMHRIDKAMSPYKPDSELSLVNREAADHPVKISAELFGLLQRSLDFSRLTNGAFDITFASAGFLYDYRAHIRPDEKSLSEAVTHINYHNIHLDPKAGTVAFAQRGVKIDLGGIAKGYAVDLGIALIQARGISNALVTAGGDTRVIGERWGRPWQIGVRDPRNRDGIVAKIPLENVAVSTSGDYERFFEEDNVRYHHIINPKTGDSARELQSATLIGPDATTTDALSTSVFVLGVNKGLALVNRLDGIDAILVDSHGRLHYSSGLEDLSSGRAKR